MGGKIGGKTVPAGKTRGKIVPEGRRNIQVKKDRPVPKLRLGKKGRDARGRPRSGKKSFEIGDVNKGSGSLEGGTEET